MIVSPSCHSSWIRGLPIAIEWKASDFNSDTVRIELCRLGSSATTCVAENVPNTGLFIYRRVPWGMIIGGGYFIKIVENNHVVTSPTFRIAK